MESNCGSCSNRLNVYLVILFNFFSRFAFPPLICSFPLWAHFRHYIGSPYEMHAIRSRGRCSICCHRTRRGDDRLGFYKGKRAHTARHSLKLALCARIPHMLHDDFGKPIKRERKSEKKEKHIYSTI